MTVEERILVLLASLGSRVPTDVVDRARAEVGYGEYGIAIENLCENLFELDVRLTHSHLEDLGNLARDLGLGDERWGFIRSLEE